MRPRTRLALLAGIILLSAAYAVLVAKDPSVASAISTGYVALVFSVFVIVRLWRKPDDHK